MKTISKRFRFNQIWEIIMIDGEIHFQTKDILQYFNYSHKSQGTLKNSVNKTDIQILTGEHIKHLKGKRIRAMVINKAGLNDFVMTRDPERFEKGKEFLKWVNDVATPGMQKIWKEKTKNEKPPESKADLFDVMNDQRMSDFNEVLIIMSERMDNMDKQIQELKKEGFLKDSFTRQGKENEIISSLIKKLTVMSHSNGLRG